MSRFLGVTAHELRMAWRRRGYRVAYGVLLTFYTVLLFAPPPLGERIQGEVIAPGDVWSVGGRFLLALNVFFPVVVGILTADRVRRDVRGPLRELQRSTDLGRGSYVLGKFTGALVAAIQPIFAWTLVVGAAMTAIGTTPPRFLLVLPVACLAITLPAFAFVVAFSLACPLVLPVPAYQILFTGYWFWANFVPPQLFPTLNGTLLTPSGIYVLQGFFAGHTVKGSHEALRYTSQDALLNLGVLAACVAVALLALERFLARQERLA